jgi:glutamate-1-semialdehyde 2,1-aminomutase
MEYLDRLWRFRCIGGIREKAMRETMMQSANGQLRQAVSTRKSELSLERARDTIAGGDNSTMRVLPYHLPLVATRGEGSRVWDVDGHEYIDLNMAYGPLIFGHRPPKVIDAVVRQLTESGSQLGFPAEVSARVAEKVKRLYPHIDLLRFSSTGSEAIAAALRLARTVTERRYIIAFEGHYHGSSDGIFHRYHAPVESLPAECYGPAVPGTLGMNGAPHDVLVCRWNCPESLERCLSDHPGEVAAVIMEPVMGNAGVIPPQPDFLDVARSLTHEFGALLIFDEVITGMRVAGGGAQERYGVKADITVLSKALGGGFPVSAVGSTRDIMQCIVDGELFHGGVYSGNTMVMAAADAVLTEIHRDRGAIYRHLEDVSIEFAQGVEAIFTRLGIPHRVHQVGPIVSMFLTHADCGEIKSYRDVQQCCDFDKYIRFQNYLQQSGVYFHPNQFEPLFFSTAHTSHDVAVALERIEDGARSALLI